MKGQGMFQNHYGQMDVQDFNLQDVYQVNQDLQSFDYMKQDMPVLPQKNSNARSSAVSSSLNLSEEFNAKVREEPISRNAEESIRTRDAPYNIVGYYHTQNSTMRSVTQGSQRNLHDRINSNPSDYKLDKYRKYMPVLKTKDKMQQQ